MIPFLSLAQAVKRTEKTAKDEMGKHVRDQSSLTVVEGKEPRRLQLPRRCRTLPLAGNARVQPGQH